MKRLAAMALALALVLVPARTPARAAGSKDAETIQQTIRALGIMVGDEQGNLNLSSPVTRAEFAKMLVAASPYKDSVGDKSGVSPFKDVKYTHWAAEYVKTAVEAGWVVGYVDGTYRPDRTITLEEAATAVLRLMGYTPADLTGTYPSAQLSKYRALGLNEGITATQGQTMTRQDCMMLFYNVMSATAKSGAPYAQSLGYGVTAAGELDYSALVEKDTKGPHVVTTAGWASLVPFSTANVTIYRNGKAAQSGDITPYDVLYYNENLRTVWVYHNRVVGVYTAAAPSTAAPTSVTVTGVSYGIETSQAAYRLSSLGEFAIGDTVTLLLGRNGQVAEVISSEETSDIRYGVVTAYEKNSYRDSAGKDMVENTVSVFCTDGVTRQYPVDTEYTEGRMVSISYEDGALRVRGLSEKRVSGTVNSNATMLGELDLAPDVEIIDADSDGAAIKLNRSRLAGATLRSEDVRFYATNGKGEITQLILKDATGDMHTYGIITSVSETNTSMAVMGSYTYVANGQKTTSVLSNGILNIKTGVARLLFEDGKLDGARPLKEAAIDSISELYAISANRKHLLADDVQIYIKKNDVYDKVNLNTVSDLGAYRLTGYYDDEGYSAGGRIRLIVATERSK